MLDEKRFEMVKKKHLKAFNEHLKEGKVDKKVISFCKALFKTKNYFPLSSCSGRVILLSLTKDEIKKDAFFHAKWHDKPNFKEFMKALNEKTTETLWLKSEPFIYHVGCKSLLYARKMLDIKDKAGVKKGGIFIAKEGKFLVELTGSNKIALPVKKKDEILLNKKQLKFYFDDAVSKLVKNDKARKRFEKECLKQIKKL